MSRRYKEYETIEYKSDSKAKSRQKNKPISLQPKTENQKDLIRGICENDIIICSGPSGTGKSMISCGMASQMLKSSQIQNIVVTRPLVSAGRDIGALPGEVNEKIKPYLMVCEEYFNYFLGIESTREFIEDKVIKLLPLELMRGSTFHNSFMILDEAQNCTLEQIKMFITRMGHGSKVMINGDIRQTDIGGYSGLEMVKNRLSKLEKVYISELTHSDIQRHDLIAKVLMALEV